MFFYDNRIFLKKKHRKVLSIQKKAVPLHSLRTNDGFGALVQLVRMPACHAGGHGFESRTHRLIFQNSTHIGALVQLVRMPACHAGGHGFESRTHRLIFQSSTHIGALVQLVRMPACHAGGHGFESRTHRKGDKFLFVSFFYATRSMILCVTYQTLPQ